MLRVQLGLRLFIGNWSVRELSNYGVSFHAFDLNRELGVDGMVTVAFDVGTV
jgi:hypothetical protein